MGISDCCVSLQKHLQIPSEYFGVKYTRQNWSPEIMVKRFGGIPTMPETFRLRNYSIIFCVYFKVQLSNYSPFLFSTFLPFGVYLGMMMMMIIIMMMMMMMG